jgi:two-component system OmpR family sensor kinase
MARLALAPGEGIAGEVWSRGVPSWVDDLRRASPFSPSREALEAGLHAVFAFAVLAGSEVAYVVELLGREPRAPEEELVHVAQSLGLQIGTFVDRHRASEAARESERRRAEELERAVAARDAFLSIASHELKTPLTALQLQLELLVRSVQAGGVGTDRVSQRIRGVSRSTERLGELVNRLLDVSRITSSGRLELRKEAFDLAELVREVAARFEAALAEAGSALRLDVAGPVAGTWDRTRIDTIVTNLLSNAVKYGDGKPIEVEVRNDADVAVLEVRDRGIGIPPEDQARIFERFERAVPEHHYGGFGIGLWVTRSVAEEHGGRIRVASRPGGGSTFVLELPRGGCTE